MSIQEFPGKHPVSVLMIFAGLLLFGGVSFFHLNLEELPEVSIPEVRIVTELAGFPAKEMENLITVPLENALSGVKNVRKMESVSKPGVSSITLRFQWDVDLERASLDVREHIDSVFPFLPHGTKKPVVFTESLSDRPILTLAVVPSSDRSPEDLYIPVKYDIKNRLQKVEGISVVELLGLRKPEVKVLLDMESLYARGMNASGVAGRIGGYLVDHPAGKIRDGERERLVKILTGLTTPAGIAQIPVIPGRSVPLADISQVVYGIRDPSSLYLFNGAPAIGIRVYKTGGFGTLNAVRGVKQVLPLLTAAFQGSLEIHIVSDASGEILRSINSLLISLALGLSAAVGVLFFLYKAPGIPLITSLSIPLTILVVFFLMYLFDISLNILSLLGLVIGIGLIADNSIVILEELDRSPDNSPSGMALVLKRISPAVFASCLTTVIVFLPPLFIPGMTGRLFRDLILTILLMIAVSFLVSHFFSPACSALVSRKNVAGASPSAVAPWIIAMERGYRAVLYRFSRRKGRTILLYLFLLGANLLIFRIIPKEVFPSRMPFEGVLHLSLIPGSTHAVIESEAERISEAMLRQWDLSSVAIESGYEEDSLRDKSEAGRFLNRLQISFTSPLPLDNDALSSFKNSAGALGWPDPVIEPVKTTFEALLTERPRDNITLSGSDRASLNNLGSLEEIEGALEIFEEKQPVLQFIPDRESLSASGLTAADLQREIQTLIHGQIAGDIPYDREKIDVRVLSATEYRRTGEDLLTLQLTLGQSSIALGELGSLLTRYDHQELTRKNRQYTVPARLMGKGEADSLIAQLTPVLPRTIAVDKADNAREEQEAFLPLFLFALVLMYLILGAQTGSALKAFILMLSLPVSISGSLLMLLFCGQSLNIYSFMGILILQGTIINTAILLLSGAEGSRVDHLFRRASLRIRPVLSTTLTTVAALLPILIQALFQRDGSGAMAAAVIGGMLLGTPLILLFVPVFYSLVLQRMSKSRPA